MIVEAKSFPALNNVFVLVEDAWLPQALGFQILFGGKLLVIEKTQREAVIRWLENTVQHWGGIRPLGKTRFVCTVNGLPFQNDVPSTMPEGRYDALLNLEEYNDDGIIVTPSLSASICAPPTRRKIVL